MATITDIGTIDPWFEDERPAYNKMISQVANKITTLIQNQVAIADEAEALLAGTGADQAVIVFAMAAAPEGWTREPAFTSGTTLRVTDGSTAPPGDSPTATGGAEGGSWTISGTSFSTSSGHTHGIGGHTHSITHNHTFSGHTHTMGNHTHTISSHYHTITARPAGTITGGNSTKRPSPYGSAPYYDVTRDSHTHTIDAHDHGGVTTAEAPTTSSLSTNVTSSASAVAGDPTSASGTSSSTTSGSDGSHTHTVSHGGGWTPKYVTSIVCSKD